MGALAAAITGASSLLGGLFNTVVGDVKSRSLMKYQAALNQKAIDAQNVYNSPLEQIKRIRAAGLNPNLVYGNGVDGNQSSAANVGIANSNADLGFDLAGAVDSYLKSRQVDNESRLTDANTKLILQNAALAEAKTLNELYDYSVKDETFLEAVGQVKANFRKTLQSIEEGEARTSNIVADTNNKHITANMLVEQVRYWKSHADAEQLQPDYLRAKMANVISSTDLNQAQRQVALSMVQLNQSRIEEIAARIRNLNSTSDINELAYKLQKDMSDFGMGNVSMKDIFGYLVKLIATISR